MQSFFQRLPRPFFALAPMEDVTDAAFRRVIVRHGKPDVVWTEFVSADGLMLAPEEGRAKLMKKLMFSPEERPIVAQIFTASPERMEQASALVASLGFDGVDINMGCPVRKIVSQECGADLIRNPSRAVDLIRAAKRGAGGLPVSVKTRAGYAKDDELAQWVHTLLAEDLAALTLHARTRNDMSKPPARWELVREAVGIRDALGVDTPIIGNGDVKDLEDGRRRAAEAGCEGVMLGRAIFGNPWLFSGTVPTPEERVATLCEHLDAFDELLGATTNFVVMRKHFKSYVHGWDHAKEVRIALMEARSSEEARAILRDVRF